MTKIYIGIDPGITGAIVAVKNGQIIFQAVMPMKDEGFDVRATCRILMALKVEHKDVFVITEKLQPIITFRVGAWQTFKLGMAYQHVLSAIQACNLPFVAVIPRSWTKRIWEGLEPIYDPKKKPKKHKKTGELLHKLDTKKMSLKAFQTFYPDADMRATEKSSKQHDGMVDAALLCRYGKLIEAV